MKVEFLGHFYKDLQRIKQQSVLDEIQATISNAEQAPGLSSLKNLKKLKGYKNVYRLSYRIGVFIDNNEIEFARIAHRKDIYKLFP